MKTRVRALAAAFLMLLLFVLPLLSCNEEPSSPEPKSRIYYSYFDTVSVFSDYTGMGEDEFDSLAKGVESSIAYYDSLFNSIRESKDTVNIATLNTLSGTGPVKVSSQIIELISFSKDMYEKTGGKVNFAMGAVTLLWKRCAVEVRVPTEAELAEAKKHISPDNVIIDREASTVEITDSECKLDLGAIAKGYAAELICTELKKQGYSGVVLDMGGNLRAVGNKPSGEGWRSGIKNPLYQGEGEEPYSRIVTIMDESLVTSGVYNRYFTVDGVRYHHIIDTETLKPESRYLSVTVRTGHSGVADALSTAVFNMSEDEAEAFAKSFDSPLELTLIFPDGSIKIFGNTK